VIVITNKSTAARPLQVKEFEMRPVPPGTKRRGPRLLRGSECDIPDVLVAILNTGLQRIQDLANSGDSARCVLEAEHLKHLPGLLTEFDLEVFDHYWNVERPAFTHAATPDALAAFDSLWQQLGKIVDQVKAERP
jgi:hypothetical protein